MRGTTSAADRAANTPLGAEGLWVPLRDSTSFADIFYNNSIKNSLLPAIVEPDDLARLVEEIEAIPGLTVTADLAAATLTTSAGSRIGFAIAAHARHALAEGLDDIEISLQHLDAIAAFEARSRERFPWLG